MIESLEVPASAICDKTVSGPYASHCSRFRQRSIEQSMR
jgi:hypothetical protein